MPNLAVIVKGWALESTMSTVYSKPR